MNKISQKNGNSDELSDDWKCPCPICASQDIIIEDEKAKEKVLLEPDWFRAVLEEELRQSVTEETLNAYWNAYKQQVLKEKEETEIENPFL